MFQMFILEITLCVHSGETERHTYIDGRTITLVFFLIPRSKTTSTRLRTSFIETATNWRV